MRFRSIALPLFFSCVLLCLTACVHCKPPKECPPPAPPSPMTTGETRFFPFPPDGEWHSSGILVLAGDAMSISAQGVAAGLQDGALLYRIGDNLPLNVRGEQSVRFEHMGPLEFRAVMKESKYVSGLLEIKITKKSASKDEN